MDETKEQVTGRERVVAAYKGGFADRVPAYPIAGCFGGCFGRRQPTVGWPLTEIHREGRGAGS
jgi:hypothetical protein